MITEMIAFVTKQNKIVDRKTNWNWKWNDVHK